jgi:predicted nucleotidyltransferase component of viral defense system
MPAPPRRSQFTANERFEFAEWLHVESLAAILSLHSWTPGRFAFQGGTALHLCYGSPRFSEDLDFLLLDIKDLEGFAQHLSVHLSMAALIRVPGSSIKVTANSHNAERNPMLFEARFQHPQVMTKLVVKLEFFKTPQPLMTPYRTELRQPRGMHSAYVMQIPGLVPTAEASEIVLDKIHAFPHRAYLKYRDVFDLWWLRQNELPRIDWAGMAPRFDYHRELYNTTQPADLGAKLRERAAQITVSGLQEELSSHLPLALYKTFTEEKCKWIIDFFRKEIETFIYHYELHHGLNEEPQFEMASSL